MFKILSKKQIDAILMKIVANEIILIDDLNGNEECVTKMSENNADITYLVGGLKGLDKVGNAIKERYLK